MNDHKGAKKTREIHKNRQKRSNKPPLKRKH